MIAKYILLFVALVYGIPQLADAQDDAEAYLMRGLCLAFSEYSKESGEPPSDWEQFRAKPYVSLEVLERRLGQPPQERYQFVKHAVRIDLPGEQATGVIVLMNKTPIKTKGRNQKGRFAILRTDDGMFRHRWFTEKEIQKAFALEKKPSDGESVHPRLTVTVEVTNPGAKLLVGEPLCIFVRANSKKDEIPDVPKWRLEIASPKGNFELELLRLDFLDRGRVASREAWIDFRDTGKDELETAFHAVLLVTADAARLEREEPGDYPILTSVAGDYQIKIKEMTSKSESPPVRFRVVAGDQQETKAGEMFVSPKALGIFMGFTDDISAYEKLVQTFPQSRYSAYASLIIGMEKLKALQHQHDEKINTLPFAEQEKLRAATARSIADLAPYFEKTLKLNFRSQFEARALLLLAQCKLEEKDIAEWKGLIRRIVDNYGDISGVNEIKEARDAFEAIRRIQQENPNPSPDN